MDKLTVPALRSRLNGMLYYVSTLSFREIADRFASAELNCDGQSAIIFGVSGNSQWREVEFNGDEEGFHNVGFLDLDKDTMLTVICGGEQIIKIQEVLREDPQRENDTWCVAFVNGCESLKF